jgi:hypothetical protein
MPMVEQSPMLGVGLNNFGDYYTRFKSPSAPEDVKDPHSFVVRLLAEAGVPVTVLLVGLLLWMIFGSTRPRKAAQETPQPQSLAPTLIAAAIGAFVWIPLHIGVESSDGFTVSMTVIYAVVAWAVIAATVVLLEELTTVPVNGVRHPLLTTRFFCLCGVIGAMAMLLYDQVNMALVTGPVAMLFWMLLGLGDSYPPAAPNAATKQGVRPGAQIAAGALSVAGLAAFIVVFVPVARGTFAWDPAPHERAFVRAVVENRPADGLQELDRAIALSPNSVELLMQRIALKRQMNLPVADDIRRVLSLDRANASVRVNVAASESDLPPSERIAALEDALRFNDALPEDEPKRLPKDLFEKAQRALAELKKASGA